LQLTRKLGNDDVNFIQKLDHNIQTLFLTAMATRHVGKSFINECSL